MSDADHAKTDMSAEFLSDEVADRLRLVIGRLSRHLRLDSAASLPPLQTSTLLMLETHGTLRVSDLARIEGVTVPTMSRVVGALTEAGLVERSANQTDGRSLLLSLSPDGARRLARIRQDRTAAVRDRLGQLGESKLAALREALPALEALLEVAGSRGRRLG